MHYFLIGLGLLIAFLLLQRWYVNANPATLARNIGRMGAGLLFVLALIAALLRRFEVAMPLGVIAMIVLQRSSSFGPSGTWGNANQKNATSVRSKRVEMTLDHDTGESDGKILEGPLEGKRFSDLDLAGLRQVLAECHTDDPEGATLLEAYLDTMHAGWRTMDDRARDETGRDGEGSRYAPDSDPGPMTREHAYEILGLTPGATQDEIRDAHRTLMRKLHPDQGGSTYLAQQINEAKDVLLNA